MSNEHNITRRNVLAGLGASGAGLVLGAHGVAAGEKKHKDKYDVPVVIDWQEAFYKNGKWKQVEAFPDEDDDGKQDDDVDHCDGGLTNGALIDVENPLKSDLRTADKYTGKGDPLIDVHGVKPGYGGEVTLGYHLCDESGKLKLEADDVAVDKKLSHLARARVWYDEFDGSNDNDDHDDNDDCDNHDHGRPGDNQYQGYDPVIAQGSLKHVLKKLQHGVRISEKPYVASPNDREGIHYYAYPRDNTSDMKTPPAEKYDPGWITDDNVDEYVDDKKVKKLKHLDEGVEICIEGTGYVARNEDKPLHDLRIKVKKVLTDKKGKPVGFKWKSNLPICRIEIAGGDQTKLNVFDRARSGTALAPRYAHVHDDDCDCDDDDHDDRYGRRRPMTGVTFGVSGDHDDDDWCIENSDTGYIGFEWWVPEHVDLKKKGDIRANFDFEAEPCDGNST